MNVSGSIEAAGGDDFRESCDAVVNPARALPQKFSFVGPEPEIAATASTIESNFTAELSKKLDRPYRVCKGAFPRLRDSHVRPEASDVIMDKACVGLCRQGSLYSCSCPSPGSRSWRLPNGTAMARTASGGGVVHAIKQTFYGSGT